MPIPGINLRPRTLLPAIAVILLSGGLLLGGGLPDIHLIVLESVRADHLPCYGYERNTTPAICAVAQDGVLFENAYSQGAGTPAAVPVILTGRYPSAVAVTDWEHRLSEQSYLLPERLARAGYRIQGYDDRQAGLAPMNVTEPDDGPRFTWSFLMGSHYPYGNYGGDAIFLDRDRKPLVTELQRYGQAAFVQNHSRQLLIDLYDSSLRAVDRVIRQRMADLKAAGTYEDSLLIITADHGELLGMGGQYGHGTAQIRQAQVPLIIKFPANRWAGQRVSSLVGHIDIVPTVLQVIGRTADLPGIPLQQIIQHPRDRSMVVAVGRNQTWSITNGTHSRTLIAQRCPHPGGQMIRELCERYQAGRQDPVPLEPWDQAQAQLERLKDLGYLEG